MPQDCYVGLGERYGRPESTLQVPTDKDKSRQDCGAARRILLGMEAASEYPDK